MSSPASDWVRRFTGPLAAGTALDIACGGGRHLRLLAEAGHRSTGIDRDLSGVADLTDRPGVELIRADLEDGSPWPLAERRFAAVVVVNYLWRPLLPQILAAVAPDGLLVYETFTLGQERFGRPRNPTFLLRPGELLEAVRGSLRVLPYEDLVIDRGGPAAVQRIAARRESGPSG